MNGRKHPPKIQRRQKASRRVKAITHAECEARLEFYVDSEQRGEDVRTQFPAIWAHLQTCDTCRISHDLIAETLRQDSSLDSQFKTGTPRELPFIQPAQKDAAWNKQVRSSIGGAPLGFGFDFNSAYLRKLFSSNAPALQMRGEDSIARRSLLMADTLSLGRRQVAVQVWAVPMQDTSRMQLQVSVASSDPLPEPLRAILQWNNHRSAALVRDGECVFDDIPADEMKDAHNLRVEFEVEPNAP